MELYKDENTENTKWEGEAIGKNGQYGNPYQQCQNHQKVTAADANTKYKEKEKHGKKKIYRQRR